MNRMILAFVVLVFVQLVNGQVPTQACADAYAALGRDTTCTTAIASSTDGTAVCMGFCRTLIDNIINNCGAAGTDFDTMIRTLCGSGNTGDACTTAINSVSNTCGTSLFNGDTSVCSGTCAAQLNAVVSACGSSGDSDIREEVNRLCGSGNMLKASRVIILLIVAICYMCTYF